MVRGSTAALGAAIIFAIGWLIGASMMFDSWKESSQRGMFEVGHVVYRVQPVSP